MRATETKFLLIIPNGLYEYISVKAMDEQTSKAGIVRNAIKSIMLKDKKYLAHKLLMKKDIAYASAYKELLKSLELIKDNESISEYQYD